MFMQGQSVVCIDGEFGAAVRQFYHELPTKGVTYTVRDVCPGQSMDGEPECAVTLVELVNPTQGKSNIERAFNAERFAPLEELPDQVEAKPEYIGEPGEEVFV
jgi:hypothetical protein